MPDLPYEKEDSADEPGQQADLRVCGCEHLGSAVRADHPHRVHAKVGRRRHRLDDYRLRGTPRRRRELTLVLPLGHALKLNLGRALVRLHLGRGLAVLRAACKHRPMRKSGAIFTPWKIRIQ